MDGSSDPKAFWLPGIVLSSWANQASQLHGPLRDPCSTTRSSRGHTADLSKAVVLYVLRVLYFLWAPVARTLSLTFWCCTALAAIAAYCRRLVTAFLGWQNEPIVRHESILARPFLSGLRRWHVTVGALHSRLLALSGSLRSQPDPRLTPVNDLGGTLRSSSMAHGYLTCSGCAAGQHRVADSLVLRCVLFPGRATKAGRQGGHGKRSIF